MYLKRDPDLKSAITHASSWSASICSPWENCVSLSISGISVTDTETSFSSGILSVKSFIYKIYTKNSIFPFIIILLQNKITIKNV